MNSVNGNAKVGSEITGIRGNILRILGAGGMLAVLLSSALPVYAGAVEITADQWARPRSGERIVDIAGLRGIVEYLDRHPGSGLLIRYAGGDEGLLWAEELRAWFVALGISGDRIVLGTGLQQRDRIVLETE